MAQTQSAIPSKPTDQSLILHCLLRRERAERAVAAMQIVVGGGLSFFGPLLLSWIVWLTLFQFGRWVAWWPVFWVTALVVIPLQYWTELRTRGSFLTDSVGDDSAMAQGADWVTTIFCIEAGFSASLFSMSAVNTASPAGIVELMLWGPRQLIAGIAKLRVIRRLAGVDRARAALVIQTLAGRNKGMKLIELLRTRESRAGLLGALGYLAHFQWLGISEDEQRVWIFTESREAIGVR